MENLISMLKKIKIICWKIQILHSKNANSASKNCSKGIAHNSELRKCKYSSSHWNSILRKCKFCIQKLQWCSNETAQNSVLREWKFWTQEMEIPRSKIKILCSENGKYPQCHGKLAFPWFFLCQIGQFHAGALKSKFCTKFCDCWIQKGLGIRVMYQTWQKRVQTYWRSSKY